MAPIPAATVMRWRSERYVVPIPSFDETIEHRRLLPELEAAVRGVLLEEYPDGKSQVAWLEEDIVAFLGGGHAVGVQSGTAALFLTVKALGIGPGDEVIAPPNSDLVTTSIVGHAGATFVLCDVEAETMNIDPALIERRITPRTKAILPVHMYGHPAEMGPILEIARRHNLFVIEDACLSFGAAYHGQSTGLIGTAGALSFGVRKVISGGGDGGMVVTHDADLARQIHLLRGVGMPPSVDDVKPRQHREIEAYTNVEEGYFLRLNEMQAAVVRVKLRHLPAWQAERQGLADRYARHFAGTPVTAPIVKRGCTHAWRDYVVLVSNRHRVRTALRERGIATAVRYSPPVHLQPVYRHLGLGPGSFPVAEHLGEQVLGLPMYPGMPPEHVDEVARTMLEAVALR